MRHLALWPRLGHNYALLYVPYNGSVFRIFIVCKTLCSRLEENCVECAPLLHYITLHYIIIYATLITIKTTVHTVAYIITKVKHGTVIRVVCITTEKMKSGKSSVPICFRIFLSKQTGT